MSWTNLLIDRDDDIQVGTTATPGYVDLTVGSSAALMMPRAKAEELHAALGAALAANEDNTGGDLDV